MYHASGEKWEKMFNSWFICLFFIFLDFFFFSTCRSVFVVKMIHELTVFSVKDPARSISKVLCIFGLGFKIQIQTSWTVSLHFQWKFCCITKATYNRVHAVLTYREFPAESLEESVVIKSGWEILANPPEAWQ